MPVLPSPHASPQVSPPAARLTDRPTDRLTHPLPTPPSRLAGATGVPERVLARLDDLYARLLDASSHFLGYPEAQRFALGPLGAFLPFNMDNLGAWDTDMLYATNSTELEAEVMNWFARLYGAHDDGWWGYVTSSGSEGNLWGIHLARETLPDAPIYYSAAAHYSVAKAARLLRLQERPLPILANGELDYNALAAALNANRRPNRSAIVVATLGTTVTGALDDLDRIRAVLAATGTRGYVHVDAALSGMILPFVDGAPRIVIEGPVGSVSVSGHKFLGAPFPCGIALGLRSHVDRIRRDVEYIGSTDATIGGSRNGQAPLHLWYQIATRGEDDGFRHEVASCLGRAAHLEERLNHLGVPGWRNPHSITVVFPEPSDRLVRRWSLARQAGTAHAVTLPHVTDEVVDRFLTELSEEPELRATV